MSLLVLLKIAPWVLAALVALAVLGFTFASLARRVARLEGDQRDVAGRSGRTETT